MKVLIAFQNTQRGWGKNIADYVRDNAPEDWQIDFLELAEFHAPVIDEPEKYLPASPGEAALLLVLAENSSMPQLTPDLAGLIGAEAVIFPVDFSDAVPRGLRRQIREKLEEENISVLFPSPFCSLTERGVENELIREFAREFGRPELDLQGNGEEIEFVEVIRSSPCGGSHLVARELEGCLWEKAAEKAGLAHQYSPCLACVDVVHNSAYISEAAVKRALRSSRSTSAAAEN